jgi:hypothetical protein
MAEIKTITKRQYALRRNAFQKKLDEYTETLNYWYGQAQQAERQKNEWSNKIDAVWDEIQKLNEERYATEQKEKNAI